jgi:integrase
MSKSVTKLLTPTFIRGAPKAPSGARSEIRDTAVGGLVLRVTDKGAKTFCLYARFPPTGAPSRPALGDATKMSLDAARKKARNWLDLIEQGKDPREEERKQAREAQERRANTFAVVAEDWFRSRSSKRKAKEVERDVTRIFVAKWGKRPITEITRRDVRDVIVAIKDEGKEATAHNLLGYIKKLFKWAVHQEVYDIGANPAADWEPKELIGEKKIGETVLSDAELGALWRAADAMPYPTGPFLQMLALTGQRKSEVAQARWREFDLAQKVWTIPPARMKAKREHVVPLAEEVLGLLAKLRRFDGGDNDCLFSTPPEEMYNKARKNPKPPKIGKRGQVLAAPNRHRKRKRRTEEPAPGARPINSFSKLKANLDAAMARELGKQPQPFILHDVRRTMRTHLSAIPGEEVVREAVIAHTQVGIKKVYNKYSYLDEKRAMLAAWERRLLGIVDPPQSDNVVQFRGA